MLSPARVALVAGAGILARIALAGALLAPLAAMAAPVAVTVANDTRPTRCAEEDNVTFTLSAPGVEQFRVEALQPAYVGTIRDNHFAPDFTGCDFSGRGNAADPHYTFTPRHKVLYQGRRTRIVGITLPSFWRPARVPVRVAGRADTGFHLIQIFRKTHGRFVEAMVLYPADGYWRIKPLPAPGLRDSGYGSSFLVGPIRNEGRPVVDIASIDITPAPLSLVLNFVHGGRAVAALEQIDSTRTALRFTLSPGSEGGGPFAMLRSMYVAPHNADVSEVRWRDGRNGVRRVEPLPAVTTLRATDVRFGRSVPSRHNTSAPDMRFSDFQAHR
ncbi:hypothetical protein [Pandoraea sp.]|uniref:hypothetical protein n=1 Tax=Pandoraea sp. TaxID=1883445 RepID=UPI0025FB5EE4|nr:hypothetical protein [Pandoraea sp.]